MIRVLIIPVIILCLQFFWEPFAWAKKPNHTQKPTSESNSTDQGHHSYQNQLTILVEARTHIQLTPISDDGGGMTGTLLDDLNLPLVNQKITIQLSDDKSEAENLDMPSDRVHIFEVETNENGVFSVDFKLSESKYRFKVQFHGTEGYAGIEETGTLDVYNRCTLDIGTELVNDGDQLTISNQNLYLIAIGHPIRLKLSPVTSGCRLPFRHAYMVSCGKDSIRVDLGENHESVVELNPMIMDSSKSIIQVSDLSTRDHVFHVRNHQSDVYFYQKLFQDEAEITYGFSYPEIHLKLSDELLENQITSTDFPKNTQMFLCSGTEKTDCINAPGLEIISPDRLSFEIGIDENFCGWNGTVEFDEQAYSGQQFEVCLSGFIWSKRKLIEISLGLLSLIIVGFVVRKYIKFRLRRRLPVHPDQVISNHEILEKWPDEFHEISGSINDARCAMMCIDEETRKPVSTTQLFIKVNGFEKKVIQWPFYTDDSSLVQVNHPDYIKWQDTIHGHGCHLIALKSRRRYVIECFECVYEEIAGKREVWGRETPNELIKLARNQSRPDIRLIEDFCNRVNRLVFDDVRIKDEELPLISDLSRKLILKSYR